MKDNLRIAQNRTWPRTVILPWNTIVGLADQGQISSSRETYASMRRRAFNSSVASFLCDMLKGPRAVVHDFIRFCKGSGFGSSRTDVSVGVRWRNHADPTLWLEGGWVPGGCKKLKLTQRMLLRSC